MLTNPPVQIKGEFCHKKMHANDWEGCIYLKNMETNYLLHSIHIQGVSELKLNSCMIMINEVLNC